MQKNINRHETYGIKDTGSNLREHCSQIFFEISFQNIKASQKGRAPPRVWSAVTTAMDFVYVFAHAHTHHINHIRVQNSKSVYFLKNKTELDN